MNILHVAHHYRPCVGGIEKVVFELNRFLGERGNSCRVICLNRCAKSGEKLPGRENFPEADVERIPFFDFGLYKLAPFSLARLREADVVHVHGLGFFFDFLVLTSFFHRKPIVLSTHGGLFHTKKHPLLKRLYFGLWARLLIRRACAIVAVSRSDRDIFSEISGSKRVEIIENGIDFSSLKEIKRKPVRNSFLFVGRLSANKGLPELLEVFSLVKRERPDFRLRIVGKEFDLDTASLERMAACLGIMDNLEFLGLVSDKELRDIYAASEFFVSASRHEGFGISALEAMAAGLIPILNNIPSFRVFAGRAGRGFITGFEDRKNAAEKIVEAMRMNPKRKRLVSRNACLFAARFDWRKKAGQYESVYRKCLA